MIMKRWIFLIILPLLALQSAAAQDSGDALRKGQLENGLTYYVKQTKLNAGRAEFYLIQNVGALMEQDNQNGLAHVLEHMAFNGTENFPKGVQTFLRRNGVSSFNAYTGQDETVYHINKVPTAKRELVDSVMLILRDWSGFMLLDSVEIEKERGVILEERRSTRDLGARIRDNADKYIYNNSKYAVHNTIGSLEVLENFKPEELRAYYNDFYRPDQQAVIVVGDINADQIEVQIKQMFGGIPKRINPKPREVYEIPENETPLYCQSIDKEVPAVSITILQRFKTRPIESLEQMMRDNLLRKFYNSMVNKRVSDYVDMDSPSFTSTSVGYSTFVRGYEAYNINVKPYTGDDSVALAQIMEQLEIIRRYGFSEKEFQSQIDRHLLNLKETELVKNKLSNEVYVTMYQNNFLKGNKVTSIEDDINISREILKKLTLKDLQTWLDGWQNSTKNFVFLIDGSDPNYNYLSSEQISGIMRDVRRSDVKQKDYSIVAEPLMDFSPDGGRIVSRKAIKSMDAQLWTLQNGAKVYYKYVNSDTGKFGLLGESSGGKSLLTPEELPSAEAIGSLAMRSGLYKHNSRMIQEILQKSSVSANLKLGETTESVSGQANTEEAEMLFQMIYLMFEKPRFDRGDFDKFVKLSKMELQSTPATAMDDVNERVQNIRMKPSPRLWKTNEMAFFDAMSFDEMTRIYNERFGNASDFVFYLVGDLPAEQAEQLVATYIGSIRTTGVQEKFVVHNFRREGSIKEDVVGDLSDQRYIINMEFNAKLKMSTKEEICLSMIERILNDRFNAEIREEQGGTYGVNVESASYTFPETLQFLGVSMQTSLEKGDQMREIIHRMIAQLVESGAEADEIEDAVMMMRRASGGNSVNRGVSYYMDALRTYAETGKNGQASDDITKIINSVTQKDLKKFTEKFFGAADCTDIIIKSKS